VHFTLQGTNVVLRCRVCKLCSHERGATACVWDVWRGCSAILFSERHLHLIIFIAKSVLSRSFWLVLLYLILNQINSCSEKIKIIIFWWPEGLWYMRWNCFQSYLISPPISLSIRIRPISSRIRDESLFSGSFPHKTEKI